MANTFKNGSVKIANDTLELIAATAAEEVEGVKGYLQKSASSNKDYKNISKINVLNGKVYIDLDLILKAEVNVRKTIRAVQANVKRQVEMMTGLKVNRVNISVNKLAM